MDRPTMNNRTASLTRTLTSEPHSQVQVIITRLLRRLLTKLKKKIKTMFGFFFEAGVQLFPPKFSLLEFPET